jgi:hypothetical protein
LADNKRLEKMMEKRKFCTSFVCFIFFSLYSVKQDYMDDLDPQKFGQKLGFAKFGQHLNRLLVTFARLIDQVSK